MSKSLYGLLAASLSYRFHSKKSKIILIACLEFLLLVFIATSKVSAMLCIAISIITGASLACFAYIAK